MFCCCYFRKNVFFLFFIEIEIVWIDFNLNFNKRNFVWIILNVYFNINDIMCKIVEEIFWYMYDFCFKILVLFLFNFFYKFCDMLEMFERKCGIEIYIKKWKMF